MHQRIRQQSLDWQPTILTMLSTRQSVGLLRQNHLESKYHIVGRELLTKHIIAVVMFIGPEKPGLGKRKLDTQLFPYQARKGSIKMLTLADPPPRHKPIALCWSIQPLTEQYVTGQIPNNQIHGDKRRMLDNG